MKTQKILTLFLFALFNCSLLSHADSSAVQTEWKSRFEAVNEACGLNSGQTPNRGPACQNAQRALQNFQAQHASEVTAITREKDLQIIRQIQTDYDRQCSQDSSSNNCKHKKALIEQAKKNGLIE